MSESAARSSLARLISRTPVSLIAASVAILAFVPAPRTAGSPARPDTLPAFKNPSGIAVGSDGSVYVSSQGDSSVVAYAPGVHGLVKPIRRIGPRSGLVSPQAVALDSRGQIVVSSWQHRVEEKGSITVYAPGAHGDAAPVRVIVGVHTGLNAPSALTLGPGGRLYVVNGPGPRVSYTNGISHGPGSELLEFDALASGDAPSRRSLRDIIDTVAHPAPTSRPPAPPVPTRTVDTLCGNPSQRGGAAICQIVDRVAEPGGTFLPPIPLGTFPQPNAGRQRPDTINPFDVTGGAGGLVVMTTRGITSYDRRLVRLGQRYQRLPPDTAQSGAGPGERQAAVGPRGELFVASRVHGPKEDWFGHAVISVYARRRTGDTVLLRTITGARTTLEFVADMAVGRDGSLYVLSAGGKYVRSSSGDARRILVFGPGADGDVAPARVLGDSAPDLKGATGLALDRGGRIYVTNDLFDEDPLFGSAAISVYASGATGHAAPIRTIKGPSTRLSKPSSIAVADEGTIYVANREVYDEDRGSVRTFAAAPTGSEHALRTLMGRGTELASPQGVAIGRGDTLYVASRRVPHITVYPPLADGRTAPVRTIEGHRTGLRYNLPRFPYSDRPSPWSRMAIDAAGYVYVADPIEASGLNAYGPDLGAVRVFRPGADGNEWPVRTIIGGFTRLNGPGGIAIDRAGNLYVPNRYATGPGTVTVYDPRADGDARPVRILAGPTTRLQAPAAVALDAYDTLYVVNAESVTIYAPGAAGDVAPVRTIEAR